MPALGGLQTCGDAFDALAADFATKSKALIASLEAEVNELRNSNLPRLPAATVAALTAAAVRDVSFELSADGMKGAEPLSPSVWNSFPSLGLVNGHEPPHAEVIKPPPQESPESEQVDPDIEEEAREKSFLSAKKAREAMQRLDISPHLEFRGQDDAAQAKLKEGLQKIKGKTPKRRLFTDIEEMKSHVRQAILKPYHVSMFYSDNIFARIAKSNWFEMLTLGVVLVNSLWIAVDIDVNGAKDTKDKHMFFQIVEYAFFAYFLSEIIIRFLAFKYKINCLRDFWFNFDMALAVLMILDTFLPVISEGGVPFDTSILRLARLIKVTRMTRLAKLLHRYPELSVLLKAIGIAIRSVGSTVALLIVMVYVFAVAFRYITIDTASGDKYFSSVIIGMKFLLLYATMPDSIDFVEDSGSEHFMIGVLVIVFVLASSLTLLNMLVGVLCEVISVVSAMEKEDRRTHLVKDQLVHVLKTTGIDANKDGLISKAEFQNMLLNHEVVTVLRDVGVDPVGLIDFTEYIYGGGFAESEDHGITFAKLIELVCELGGSNGATVKDVIDMRQVVINQLSNIEDILEAKLVQKTNQLLVATHIMGTHLSSLGCQQPARNELKL